LWQIGHVAIHAELFLLLRCQTDNRRAIIDLIAVRIACRGDHRKALILVDRLSRNSAAESGSSIDVNDRNIYDHELALRRRTGGPKENDVALGLSLRVRRFPAEIAAAESGSAGKAAKHSDVERIIAVVGIGRANAEAYRLIFGDRTKSKFARRTGEIKVIVRDLSEHRRIVDRADRNCDSCRITVGGSVVCFESKAVGSIGVGIRNVSERPRRGVCYGRHPLTAVRNYRVSKSRAFSVCSRKSSRHRCVFCR